MNRQDNPLAMKALAAARECGATIVTAESCTGGLVAAALTDIAGSSDVFERGFVTYSYAAKTDDLGVPHELLHAHGAVSEIVARHMAEGALANSRATLSVAITGVAGPGASDRKLEGLVHFATAMADQDTLHERCAFGALGRAEVRRKSVQKALELLILRLGGAC